MSKKARYTEEEPQDPEFWDWETAELHQGIPNAGAVVSVRFSGDEFECVAGCAERSGKRVTDFIREVALEKARAEAQHEVEEGSHSWPR